MVGGSAAQTSERWLGTYLGRPEHLYREALDGWEENKQTGCPNGKVLDVTSRQLEAIGNLYSAPPVSRLQEALQGQGT